MKARFIPPHNSVHILPRASVRLITNLFIWMAEPDCMAEFMRENACGIPTNPSLSGLFFPYIGHVRVVENPDPPLPFVACVVESRCTKERVEEGAISRNTGMGFGKACEDDIDMSWFRVAGVILRDNSAGVKNKICPGVVPALQSILYPGVPLACTDLMPPISITRESRQNAWTTTVASPLGNS